MGRKQKHSKEVKLLAIKQYQEGIKTTLELMKELDVSDAALRAWIKKYETLGENAFDDKPKNRSYDKMFKLKVIMAYLNGEGSYLELATKYDISSKTVLQHWVSKYNRDIEIKDYNPKGYVYMAKSRKVSYEEKLEIINWTIENDHQYKLAAEKFDTSYAQVFNWVKKFKQDGKEGLIDNRGKRKEIEDLSELGKLKREVELLRRKNERLEMEAEVKKKFQEIEGRDLLTKSGKKPNIKR
ncbi:MAG: transposase [Erysipelotrichia bacterium]|nr:transposase [Erysipelotrichia bacterium]